MCNISDTFLSTNISYNQLTQHYIKEECGYSNTRRGKKGVGLYPCNYTWWRLIIYSRNMQAIYFMNNKFVVADYNNL